MIQEYQTTPRIRTLEARITQLETKQQTEQAAAEAQTLRIRTLETIRDEATDIYEEQRAVEKLAKINRKPIVVSDITLQIRELNTQITELKAADQINYEEKVAATQLKIKANQSPTPGEVSHQAILPLLFLSSHTLRFIHENPYSFLVIPNSGIST